MSYSYLGLYQVHLTLFWFIDFVAYRSKEEVPHQHELKQF